MLKGLKYFREKYIVCKMRIQQPSVSFYIQCPTAYLLRKYIIDKLETWLRELL